MGKEIVSRFTASGIASAKTWTSDSNGRDAQVRVRDHRRSFNYQVYEPVAGNFVPVNRELRTRAAGAARVLARVPCALSRPQAPAHRSAPAP